MKFLLLYVCMYVLDWLTSSCPFLAGIIISNDILFLLIQTVLDHMNTRSSHDITWCHMMLDLHFIGNSLWSPPQYWNYRGIKYVHLTLCYRRMKILRIVFTQIKTREFISFPAAETQAFKWRWPLIETNEGCLFSICTQYPRLVIETGLYLQ